MRVFARLVAIAFAGATLFAGAAWGLACWRADLVAGLDLPGAGHALMTQIHQGDALAARDGPVRERLQGKGEVVSALLDGRLSLREAADEFRRMNEEKATAEGRDAAGGADLASDDAVYQNLLTWVHAAADSPKARARAAELRAEAASVLHRPLQGL